MRRWILFKRSVQQLCWAKRELSTFKKSIILLERYKGCIEVFGQKCTNLQICVFKTRFSMISPSIMFLQIRILQGPYFCFDCFMNKNLYSKIINAHHYSDWEVIFASKTTFTPFLFEGAWRNPPLKYSLSWSLLSYFSTSILNAEKISDLAVCFVTPQTWMCERKCFEIANLWGNLTYSQMLHRWGASTGVLN